MLGEEAGRGGAVVAKKGKKKPRKARVKAPTAFERAVDDSLCRLREEIRFQTGAGTLRIDVERLAGALALLDKRVTTLEAMAGRFE